MRGRRRISPWSSSSSSPTRAAARTTSPRLVESRVAEPARGSSHARALIGSNSWPSRGPIARFDTAFEEHEKPRASASSWADRRRSARSRSARGDAVAERARAARPRRRPTVSARERAATRSRSSRARTSTSRSSRCTAASARTAASRALLELLGIPYTGSSVLASALAMDKLKAKELFRLHNVPTPPYYVFGASTALADLEEIHGSFGFPVIVKPRGEGSSLGVAQRERPERARAASRRRSRYDSSVVCRALRRGQRGPRRHPRRPRARRDRDRAEERALRLRGQVHAGHDRVLHAGAPPAARYRGVLEPRRARGARARHAAAPCASICS